MLNFQNQMNWTYDTVKKTLEQTPFTLVEYPDDVTPDNWDIVVMEAILPRLTGTLYFIYDCDKTLLYIGKSQKLEFALRNYLLRKTSRSTSSILERLKLLVTQGEEKRIYVKALDFQPKEYSSCFKPLLVKEYLPAWVKRIN